jgi:hypothetical protein
MQTIGFGGCTQTTVQQYVSERGGNKETNMNELRTPYAEVDDHVSNISSSIEGGGCGSDSVPVR